MEAVELRRPNNAVAKVADEVKRTGKPFIYNREKVAELRVTGEQPFLEALKGFDFGLQLMLTEGTRIVTFYPDRRVGKQRS